jgi:hypothetical protein
VEKRNQKRYFRVVEYSKIKQQSKTREPIPVEQEKPRNFSEK